MGLLVALGPLKGDAAAHVRLGIRLVVAERVVAVGNRGLPVPERLVAGGAVAEYLGAQHVVVGELEPGQRLRVPVDGLGVPALPVALVALLLEEEGRGGAEQILALGELRVVEVSVVGRSRGVDLHQIVLASVFGKLHHLLDLHSI